MYQGRLAAAAAFWRTKYLAWRLSSPARLRAWQQRQLSRFLARDLAAVDFYKDRARHRLSDLPLMDKATLMANFARLNRPGITAQEVRAALEGGGEHVRGYVVGQSTGTSGNRGLFVISEAERFAWLGTILAKALPDVLWARHRLALIMPAYGQLYRAAARAGRLTLRFFDLKAGVDAWLDELCAYAPDIIVAPPKVLRAVAERTSLTPRQVFSGAELLDDLDRAVIEARFGTVVREIYMATEGLFGVACAQGTLHLAEDVAVFEYEAQPGSDLVTPIITSFTRQTQIMARYRMNDLLRLRPTPCPCGSPFQAVAAVVGRQDDVFMLGAVMVTPDVLRNAVVDADRQIEDFRITQTGPMAITVSLPASLPPGAGQAALASLHAALGRLGVEGVALALDSDMSVPFDKKLRRVRRAFTP
jgi:putative adenylate-forming enzyme